MPSSKAPIGLLDIPVEIRLHIYQYCLVREDHIRLSSINSMDSGNLSERGLSDIKKSLLLVSKTVGLEAIHVLYGENVFQVFLPGGRGFDLQEIFTEANIRRMRRMEVIIQPYCADYAAMLDPTLSSPILARLSHLSIMAQQPLHASPNKALFSLEWDVEEWMVRLRAFLQYIVHQLPSSLIIEVDDDGRKPTSDLMRECLHSRYRNVRTLVGDYYFERN